MKMLQSRFLNTLFDAEDMICISDDVFGRQLQNLNESSAQYVALNSMEFSRKDANVTKFRNILIEIDKMPIDQQIGFLIKKVPFSTLTFSGGKSYHAVISLEEPLKTRQEYDELVKFIYAAVPEADPSCKNPSRFTRLGEGLRKPEQVLQTVHEIPGRRSLKEVLAFYGMNELPPPAQRQVAVGQIGPYRVLSPFTAFFLRHGAEDGHWHNELVKAVCELTRVGYTVEEIKDKVFNINKELDKHDVTTIESCYKMAGG